MTTLISSFWMAPVQTLRVVTNPTLLSIHSWRMASDLLCFRVTQISQLDLVHSSPSFALEPPLNPGVSSGATRLQPEKSLRSGGEAAWEPEEHLAGAWGSFCLCVLLRRRLSWCQSAGQHPSSCSIPTLGPSCLNDHHKTCTSWMT